MLNPAALAVMFFHGLKNGGTLRVSVTPSAIRSRPGLLAFTTDASSSWDSSTHSNRAPVVALTIFTSAERAKKPSGLGI